MTNFILLWWWYFLDKEIFFNIPFLIKLELKSKITMLQEKCAVFVTNRSSCVIKYTLKSFKICEEVSMKLHSLYWEGSIMTFNMSGANNGASALDKWKAFDRVQHASLFKSYCVWLVWWVMNSLSYWPDVIMQCVVTPHMYDDILWISKVNNFNLNNVLAELILLRYYDAMHF